MNQTIKQFKARKSVRVFEDKPIESHLKDEILNSAFQAPMVLIFLADYQRWYDCFKLNDCNPRKPGEGDIMLASSDALIAAQNTVVAAESLGIGSKYGKR